jgi:hypothetical protein
VLIKWCCIHVGGLWVGLRMLYPITTLFLSTGYAIFEARWFGDMHISMVVLGPGFSVLGSCLRLGILALDFGLFASS